MQIKTSRFIRALAAIAVAAGVATTALSAGQAPVEARANESVTVSFTKWVTSFPTLTGFISGDAGAGAFSGEVITRDPTVAKGMIIEIEAIYQFKGGAHAFDAHVHVRQNARKGTAVIYGVVTDGWMEGALIAGEYKVIKCEQAANNVCFQGFLELTQSPAH